jgi:hypothetical protein
MTDAICLRAIEALMLVADLGGPPKFARIGMMRALNRRCSGVQSGAKRPALGRRKL